MARRRRAPLAEPSRPKALVYTAQDVARFCEVDLKTVHHWADRGKIVHRRTEGRHLRFRRNDVVRFLRAHGYPIPEEASRVKPSVALTVFDGADDLAKKLGARLRVRRYPSGIVAISSLLAEQPDALVVRLDDPSLAGARTIAALKSAAETAWVVVATVGGDEREAARAAGAEIAIGEQDLGKLPTELAKVLALA